MDSKYLTAISYFCAESNFNPKSKLKPTMCRLTNTFHILFWYFFLSAVAKTEESGSCNPPEEYTYYTDRLSCSNITSLSTFEFPAASERTIEGLWISNSKIVTIPANYFQEKFPKLTDLSLANVGIQEINAGSLSKSLKDLNLSGNNISHLEDNVFSGLTQLKSLNLKHNQLEELCLTPDSYHLSELYISHNKIRKIKSSSLQSSLLTVDLAHNEISEIEPYSFQATWWMKVDASYNKLTILHDHIFSSWSSGINTFNASHNKIKTIEAQAFGNAPYLQRVDLSYNDLSDIQNGSLCGIGSMYRLYLSHNQLSGKDVELLASCSKVETLDVSHNRISSLKPETFKNSTLQKLALSDNEIQELHFAAISGPHLYDVDLQRNKIKILQGDCTDIPGYLYLSHNEIQRIKSNTFRNCSETQFLMMDHNKISVVETGAFDHIIIHHLNLSYNRIEQLVSGSFRGNIKEYLDLSHNEISNIMDNALDLPELHTLHLDHNLLSDLPNNFCTNCSELYKLTVSFNKIEHLGPKVFENTKQLRFLDVSNNQIEVIDSMTFKDTIWISEIYFQNNRLTGFEDNTFENCHRLEYLNFSNNRIKTIPQNLFISLSDPSKHFHWDLSNNKLKDIKREMFPPVFPSCNEGDDPYIVEINLKGNEIAKDALKTLAMEFLGQIVFRNPDTHTFINATLDSQSCSNFIKEGNCIVTKFEDHCCMIDVKNGLSCNRWAAK